MAESLSSSKDCTSTISLNNFINDNLNLKTSLDIDPSDLASSRSLSRCSFRSGISFTNPNILLNNSNINDNSYNNNSNNYIYPTSAATLAITTTAPTITNIDEPNLNNFMKHRRHLINLDNILTANTTNTNTNSNSLTNTNTNTNTNLSSKNSSRVHFNTSNLENQIYFTTTTANIDPNNHTNTISNSNSVYNYNYTNSNNILNTTNVMINADFSNSSIYPDYPNSPPMTLKDKMKLLNYDRLNNHNIMNGNNPLNSSIDSSAHDLKALATISIDNILDEDLYGNIDVNNNFIDCNYSNNKNKIRCAHIPDNEVNTTTRNNPNYLQLLHTSIPTELESTASTVGDDISYISSLKQFSNSQIILTSNNNDN